MVTGKEYAHAAQEILNEKPQVGYIWGTSLITWTAQRQANLEKKYYSDPSKYKDYEMGAKYGKKWIGHRVVDCSGLTSKLGEKFGLKYYHGSNSSWRNDCVYKGEKIKGMKLPAGAWMYTGTSWNSHGHIGIVDESGEWVIEAQGTKAGVTRTKVSASKWTYWGLGKGIEFDFIPGQESASTAPVTEPQKPAEQPATDTKPEPAAKTYPTLRRGARGENVTLLQTMLSKDGSKLAIDGIFGPGTQSAVRAFQKKYDLKVDGIVGPQTWKKLRELYG